jgi:RNA polymerase sigma-70 factor (ECF subfamily)
MLAPLSLTEETIDSSFAALLEQQDYREATARMARDHGASVGRICFVLLRSQEEAREVAQETFLAAFKALPSYRGDGSVRAWLFGIARRQCARRLERGARPHLELVEELAADPSSPEASAARTRRSEKLRAAVASLKPSERDAVVLHYAAGLSFREVAEAMSISEAAARKRASRGLMRLRDRIRPEDVE